VELRNLQIGPPITKDTSNEEYLASLRSGLDLSHCMKGLDHAETQAHINALFGHLKRLGKFDAAHALRLEFGQKDKPN